MRGVLSSDFAPPRVEVTADRIKENALIRTGFLSSCSLRKILVESELIILIIEWEGLCLGFIGRKIFTFMMVKASCTNTSLFNIFYIFM